MKKSLLAILLGLCFGGYAEAQTEVNINGDWLFRYAGNETAADSIAKTEFYSTEYNADGWDRITVPSCWAVLGYEEPVYPSGVYLKALERML